MKVTEDDQVVELLFDLVDYKGAKELVKLLYSDAHICLPVDYGFSPSELFRKSLILYLNRLRDRLRNEEKDIDLEITESVSLYEINQYIDLLNLMKGRIIKSMIDNGRYNV